MSERFRHIGKLLIHYAVFMACILFSCTKLSAEVIDTTKTTVHLAYDVNFEMNFDNREYNTTLTSSSTIFGGRLTPSVGIGVDQSNGMTHKVMAGIDIMKDFGRSSDGSSSEKHKNASLFQEIIFYYRFGAQFGKTGFSLTAGIFPKALSPAQYPLSFVSDSLKFYDNNYEGLLISFTRPNSYYEIGCDWVGMKGNIDRERFMLFSYGTSQLNPWLSMGYAAYLYHYAGSEEAARGVVDNILINPWICFDIAPFAPLQQLSLTFGWLQGAQQDRQQVHKYLFPCGGEITFDIRKWNVGIQNKIFLGKNMMPYYDTCDDAGYKYGSNLYWGDPLYRLNEDNDTHSFGYYDRLEAYWQPHIAKFLDLRVSVVGQFLEGFFGCQQKVTIVFNLNKLLQK